MLFNFIGALGGALMMWIAPDTFGMIPLLALIQQNLPLLGQYFHSFAWPGVCLLVLIGLPHLSGAALTMSRSSMAPMQVVSSGLILLAWIVLQLMVVFGPNPMSVGYLVIALIEITIGVLWSVRNRKQRAAE